MSTGRTSSAGQQQNINAKQNEASFLELLHAADVAHANGQRWETARATVALASSCGSLIAAFLHSVAIPMSILGGCGSIAVLAMTFVSQAHTKEATKIQEIFDIRLFDLPPTDEFKPLPTDEEIGKLAQHYRKKPKVDWYVEVSGLPRPYAVLLCQRENLQWDWPLRRRWASILLTVATTWVIVGLAVALVADWTTRELLLRWLIPSLPGLILGANLVIKNRQIAREKQQMALEVDEKLGVLPAIKSGQALPGGRYSKLMQDCRIYQDRIFRLRSHAERVPARLYRKYRSDDEGLARAAASRLRTRLLGDGH